MLQQPFPSAFMLRVEDIFLFCYKAQRGDPVQDLSSSLLLRSQLLGYPINKLAVLRLPNTLLGVKGSGSYHLRSEAHLSLLHGYLLGRY